MRVCEMEVIQIILHGANVASSAGEVGGGSIGSVLGL